MKKIAVISPLEANQAEKLGPCSRVRLKAAVHAASHRDRPLLLHASHNHAHVTEKNGQKQAGYTGEGDRGMRPAPTECTWSGETKTDALNCPNIGRGM